MNKKSKRITLGLVSALCLLLVVALGFGVTGAWYRARRTASGTIYLDQGIILTVNNLNYNGGVDYDASTPLSNTQTAGSFWELSIGEGASDDTLVALTDSSTQPGSTATKYIAVPTIAAAANSTSFFAKAKLVISYTKYENAQTRTLATGNSATVTLDSLYVSNGDGTYRPAVESDIYFTTGTGSSAANAIAFASGWYACLDSNSQPTGYMVYGSNATTPTAFTAGGNAVAILKDDALDNADSGVAATIGFDKVMLKEWTGDNNTLPANYVEFGGPKFYTGTAYDSSEHTLTNPALFEIGQISYSMVIDVIQSTNLGSSVTAWLQATA